MAAVISRAPVLVASTRSHRGRFIRSAFFRTPARGEVARIAKRRRSAAEEVGVERQDDVGLLEAVLRVDEGAERHLRADARVVAARRIPLVPFRRREAGEQIADLRRERRRAHRLGEDAKAGAFERLLRR
jgi:hypothetical protein